MFTKCLSYATTCHFSSLKLSCIVSFYLSFLVDIWRCIRQIGDLVFKRFLELISKRDCNRKRDEELEAHTQFLLVKFNHENGSIRRVADRFLSEMVDRLVLVYSPGFSRQGGGYVPLQGGQIIDFHRSLCFVTIDHRWDVFPDEGD